MLLSGMRAMKFLRDGNRLYVKGREVREHTMLPGGKLGKRIRTSIHPNSDIAAQDYNSQR